MSRDRSSSIMAKLQSDHEQFFAVASAFPDSAETPITLGFEIQDKLHNKEVPEAFNAYILHFTKPLSFRKIRTREGWLCKIKVSGESVANRIRGVHSFHVWDRNKNDNVRYFAAHTLLKEVEIRKNLLHSLIDKDPSIFEDQTAHKIHLIRNDEVFCVWVRHATGEIFVCYKRRPVKIDGKRTDGDPFWSFVNFDSEGNPSDVDILEDIDPDFKGARFCLERLCGINQNPTIDRRGIYEQNISRFERQINLTNPISFRKRECVPRETDKGWAFPKYGVKCLPVQIQAFKFAKEMGLTSEDSKEREFWANVTIGERMEANYREKFDKPKFFRRKKKDGRDKGDIVDI